MLVEHSTVFGLSLNMNPTAELLLSTLETGQA